MPSKFEYFLGVGLHVVVLYMWKIETFPFIWEGVRYRADKKYKKCLGKLCFKGKLQADSFLVELVFILLSHISQGDSLVTFEMDYMLLF